MSSPQSLFGLVTQLQHIEQKLTDILLEAAMKMSSLTDSSVFILVETKDGRKFSGKPHLCDAYRNSRLTPTEADVECLVDLNSKTINYSSMRGGLSSSPSSFGVTSTLSPLARGAVADHRVASRKRACEAGNADDDDDDDDVVVEEPGAKMARNPEKDASFTLPPTAEPCLAPLKTEREGEDEIIFLRDAIEGNAEILSVDGRREASSGTSFDLALPSSAALEQSFEELFSQNKSVDLGAWMPCDVDAPVDDPSEGLPIPPKTVEKMKALSAMNPEDVLQKDGVGAKVLNSVIYDLSKETYKRCLNLGIDSPKDFRSKQLLMSNFEGWFSKNLRHIVHSTIVVKTGRDNSSAIAFCKSIARKYLYSAYKGRKMS